MLSSNFLQGQRVRLTALAQEDLKSVARWYQDAGFLRLMDAVPARPKTENELQAWMASAHKAKDGFLFAIRKVDADQLLGFVELDGILWNQQNGWLGIAIGERADWDQGMGQEAMELALRFIFDELNLHRISLSVFAYNERAIALYEKLGFRREGVQREALYRDGQRYDMIWYGLLCREWRSSRHA